jgi:hypothetical protein
MGTTEDIYRAAAGAFIDFAVDAKSIKALQNLQALQKQKMPIPGERRLKELIQVAEQNTI